MQGTMETDNFLKAFKRVASKKQQKRELQTAFQTVIKQPSKENLSKTIRNIDREDLQDILIFMAGEGNSDEVTSVDAGSSSGSSCQMSQSAIVKRRGEKTPPFSATYTASSVRSKDNIPSSAPDTSSDQLSVDIVTLNKMFPPSDWRNILEKLKTHLEETDKHLQEKQDSLKTVTSSLKAGDKIKAPQKEVETGAQKKMKGSSDPVWKSYLPKLEDHLENRDKLVQEFDVEIEDYWDRYNKVETELKKREKQLSEELEEKEKQLSGALKEKKEANERANNNELMMNKQHQELSDMTEEKKKAVEDKDRLSKDNLCMQKDIKNLIQEKNRLQVEKNDQMVEVGMLKSRLQQAKDEAKRHTECLKETFESERRTWNHKLMELEKEKNDLRDRFSKVAGQKLAEKNADIADLSDPNRAMKLSERFSQIYDDDWTDAFQALGDRKMKSKGAIQVLLNILKGCYEDCEDVAAQQLEDLKTSFIQPVKTVFEGSKGHAGIKGKPRLSSKHERILKDARRQMWDASVDNVKQMILEKMKEWMKKEVGPKAFDDTKVYIEKCTETCWLMVIHEPPIYMKMDTKQGEKLDANLYTAYSVSGEKIDYLVWPPLFNGKDGGLLSKGVAEPLKTIKRDQK